MAGAGLCLILGGVGAIISYRIKGATEQTAMIGGTGVALALIVFLVHMLTDEEFEELLLQIKQELPYLTQADIDDYLTFYEEYLTQEQYQELVEALQVTQSL